MIIAFPPGEIGSRGFLTIDRCRGLPRCNPTRSFNVLPQGVPFEHLKDFPLPLKKAYRPADFGNGAQDVEDNALSLCLSTLHSGLTLSCCDELVGWLLLCCKGVEVDREASGVHEK